jgi:hypothetical protein
MGSRSLPFDHVGGGGLTTWRSALTVVLRTIASPILDHEC